jgi:hypothetical protein
VLAHRHQERRGAQAGADFADQNLELFQGREVPAPSTSELVRPTETGGVTVEDLHGVAQSENRQKWFHGNQPRRAIPIKHRRR